MANGRGNTGKRGIGDGKASHKTTPSKPGSTGGGIKKTGGDGLGGKKGKK